MDASLRTDLQSVRSLLDSATKYLNGLELYARGRGVYLDATVLAILSKSIRVGNAICLLVEHDFHSEAFALSRTMLELALFARYISNADSFKRSETFVKYFAKDHETWTKLISKYYPAAVPTFHPDHAKMLEIAQHFKDPHKWSGKNVKELAMEDDAFETMPDGSPFRWEFDYEVIYKWTSHYVHGTVVAVDEHATGPREPFKVKGGPNVGKAGMALFNSVLYLHRSFLSAFRSIKHDISQAMLDTFDKVLKGLVH
jgi:Family of unknown function (DUF5677)